MSQTPLPSPIDPAIAELLALFEGPLEGISFPDVDRATLIDLAEVVRRSAADVEAARVMLENAEAALDARQQVLLSRGQRALAYARIYASDQPELSAALDRIGLPRFTKRGVSAALEPRVDEPGRGPDLAPRRRGRPPKVRDGAPLFGEATAEDAVEGASLSS